MADLRDVTLDAFGESIAAAPPLRRIGRASAYLTGTVIPVDGGIATTASGTSA